MRKVEGAIAVLMVIVLVLVVVGVALYLLLKHPIRFIRGSSPLRSGPTPMESAEPPGDEPLFPPPAT